MKNFSEVFHKSCSPMQGIGTNFLADGKRGNEMASIKKFESGAVCNQLRHIERTIKHPSNEDIDSERLNQDYNLAPDRGVNSFSYYKYLIDGSYVYGRDDIKTMAGIIVTAPQDLPEEMETEFFKATYDFLAEKLGGENELNILSAPVHYDESGKPHMHFCFVPLVPDEKHAEYKYKVCMNDLLTREFYRDLHPSLQKHLDDAGIKCTVASGITKRQGGNMTVKQLKQQRELEHEQSLNDAWKHKAETFKY